MATDNMLGLYFKVIQVNHLKLRTYSFIYVSLQLDVVPYYQYFHSIYNTSITAEKFDSANHLINTH